MFEIMIEEIELKLEKTVSKYDINIVVKEVIKKDNVIIDFVFVNSSHKYFTEIASDETSDEENELVEEWIKTKGRGFEIVLNKVIEESNFDIETVIADDYGTIEEKYVDENCFESMFDSY